MRRYIPLISNAVTACLCAAALTAMLHLVIERDRKDTQHRDASARAQAFDAAERASMHRR